MLKRPQGDSSAFQIDAGLRFCYWATMAVSEHTSQSLSDPLHSVLGLDAPIQRQQSPSLSELDGDPSGQLLRQPRTNLTFSFNMLIIKHLSRVNPQKINLAPRSSHVPID